LKSQSKYFILIFELGEQSMNSNLFEPILKNFKISSYQFHIKPLDHLTLPLYKGATFRGGFGYAFRKVVCSTHQQNCIECLLKDKCIYAYIFETPLPFNAVMMRKYPQVPHPFIIEPPKEDREYYNAGEEMSFNLILIGRAIDYLPYFIYTFEELGRIGIGKDRDNYLLKGVCVLGLDNKIEEIYSDTTKRVKTNRPPVSFKEIQKSIEDKKTDKLLLRFYTPTRIRYNAKLTMELTFDILIRNLLRRISALSYFHCGEELRIDFRDMIASAEKIEVEKSSLQWYDWERYSTRQKSRMKLGGFVGEISFSGNLKDFLPLLKLGELTHVGKGTTFGLGKYSIIQK
jgi:CRISPR-associated endoribonuclease Cas6